MYLTKIPLHQVAVASFLPLAIMNGDAGKFVKTLPILVTLALSGSFLGSITIVTALGHLLFKAPFEINQNKLGELMKKFSAVLHLNELGDKSKDIYGKLLTGSLKKPRLILLSFVALLAVSLVVVPTLPVQLFPPVECEQYVLNVVTQDGTTLEKSEEMRAKVADVLREEKSVDPFVCTVGESFMKYYVTFEPEQQATHKAQLLINGTRSDATSV